MMSLLNDLPRYGSSMLDLGRDSVLIRLPDVLSAGKRGREGPMAEQHVPILVSPFEIKQRIYQAATFYSAFYSDLDYSIWDKGRLAIPQ